MLIVRSNITLLITLHTSLIICQFMNVNGIHTLYRPKEKSQQIKSDGKKKNPIVWQVLIFYCTSNFEHSSHTMSIQYWLSILFVSKLSISFSFF